MACTKKITTVDVKPEFYFVLGSGGGVSGQFVEYKVHRSGQVEWYDFKQNKYVPYSVLTSKMTIEMWSQLDNLNVQGMKLDNPGNFTYYIEYVKDGSSHKIKWNDETGAKPAELQQFFKKSEHNLENLK